MSKTTTNNWNALQALEEVSFDITRIRDNMEILNWILTDQTWDIPESDAHEFSIAVSLFGTIFKSVTVLEVLTVDSIEKLYASGTTSEQENKA